MSFSKCPTLYKCALLCIDTIWSLTPLKNPTPVSAVTHFSVTQIRFFLLCVTKKINKNYGIFFCSRKRRNPLKSSYHNLHNLIAIMFPWYFQLQPEGKLLYKCQLYIIFIIRFINKVNFEIFNCLYCNTVAEEKSSKSHIQTFQGIL